MVLPWLIEPILQKHPRLRRYLAVVHEDLTQTYSRDIQKWLLVGPIVGVVTGLAITGLTYAVLDVAWSRILPIYLTHHWAIIPGLLIGFVLTGLIMQFRAPDPDLHSTEEIIRSYHDHHGYIDMRSFFWKLAASMATVGSGGSAALEGPSIYAGGAIGSWLWNKLGRFGLEPSDQRLMLMCGAAAGMGAVFKAPLTGLVFALEMPYKDDIAHEALLPSLISSVVAYGTMAALIGAEPLFGFGGGIRFKLVDLGWSAVLGIVCGLIAMVFTVTYRHFRSLMINLAIPHTAKLALGGLMTGVCGLLFITMFPGGLIPIGPNYEAVRTVLAQPLSSIELVIFAAVKLGATLFSLGAGGVAAMFVPLFLTGGAIGRAFGQSLVHAPAFDLYAAVGMASFIAAGYKTPLAAVVFVAEATGNPAFIIPTLIGAACAYAVSGESSASGDQQLREVKLSAMIGVPVRDVMQRRVVSVQASASLREFAQGVSANSRHAVFPVYDGDKVVGTLAVWNMNKIPPERWDEVTVGEICNRSSQRIPPSWDLLDALRMLSRPDSQQILLVGSADGVLEGILTKTDILRALETGGPVLAHDRREDAV